MKKTFQLNIEGKNRDRVLDAVRHEIRKYIKRERRRDLPAGADYWDFDCRFGLTPEAAEVVHLNSLTGLVDGVAREGGNQFYLEILARPAHRKVRPPDAARSPDHETPQSGQPVDPPGASAPGGAARSRDTR